MGNAEAFRCLTGEGGHWAYLLDLYLAYSALCALIPAGKAAGA